MGTRTTIAVRDRQRFRCTSASSSSFSQLRSPSGSSSANRVSQQLSQLLRLPPRAQQPHLQATTSTTSTSRTRSKIWTGLPRTQATRRSAPPVHAGSGGARGGRRRSRCCCVFAHVAAAASRARTHGSPGHNFSTAIAISEVPKPPRAPLARGFGRKI